MNRSKITICFLLFVFCLLLSVFVFRGNLKFAVAQLLASVNIFSKAEVIGSGGFGNSFALSSDGKPAASYISENQGLIFAEKNNGDWKKEIVDSEALAGNATSLAFDNEGKPNILYVDKDFFLKLAKKEKGDWQIEKIFEGAALSLNLVFDKKSVPILSFWDQNKGTLIFGKKEKGKWKVEVVESVEVGWWNDLALNKKSVFNDKEKLYVSYYDFKNKDLLCAFFGDAKWQKEIVDFEGDVGRWNSISLNKENQPHISYFDEDNSDLKYARKVDSGWEIETVDEEGGERTNISLDKKGNPVISYISNEERNASSAYISSEARVEKYLKEDKDSRISSSSFGLARKNNHSWQIRTIDSGEIGDNSLLIDDEGNVHLLWQDLFSDKLKYLNLSF